MGRQLGFGFGKGRRVIKTIYAGDALQAALARQRQWFRLHGVEHAAPQTIGVDLATGTARTVARQRMAKATLRPRETPDPLITTSNKRGGLETPNPPVLPSRVETS